jgi:hypothetical protein
VLYRWPKDFNSAICERVYEKNNLVDCDHRPGSDVAISSKYSTAYIEIMTNIYSFLIVTGNQDNLPQLRQQLILDQSSAKKNANELRGTKQKTRRSLVYPEGDNTQEASFPVVAKKSNPNPAETQLVKVKHFSLMCLRVLPFCALLIVTCFNSSHAVGNVFMVS